MKWIYKELKYRANDFWIFFSATMEAIYTVGKEKNAWIEAILVYIVMTIPFLLASFIVNFFTLHPISKEVERIKKMEKELEDDEIYS